MTATAVEVVVLVRLLALALGVTVLATFVPAARAARQSTIAALHDSVGHQSVVGR